jgi:hypothetical protein
VPIDYSEVLRLAKLSPDFAGLSEKQTRESGLFLSLRVLRFRNCIMDGE